MNYKKARNRIIAGWLTLLGPLHVDAADCDPGVAERADMSYEAGLASYRAGLPEPAYAQLKSASDQCPLRPRYRNDFLVAAVSAGHAEEALGIASGIALSALPPYVLEALGRGARDLRRPELALRYYDAIPGADGNPTVRAGRDLVFLDQGRIAEARLDLIALRERFPDRMEVLEALGLAAEAAGDWIAALAAAESLLQREPAHDGALALRYRLLVRLGAPHLAAALTPDAITTPAQRGATLQEALAFEFRWARDMPRPDRERAAQLDAVIARMRAAAADPALPADANRRVRTDLVEALQTRGRAREAVTEYEALASENPLLAPHAITAAADASLTLHQPGRAAELFRSLPAGEPVTFGAKSTYFYALLEGGHPREALAWAMSLSRQEPQYLDADSPWLRSDNPDYMAAEVLAALALAYADELDEAQQRLDALLARAPGNPDVNLALSEVLALRGLPRESAALATSVRQLYPDLGAAMARLFDAQLQMADWPAAAATLQEMDGQRAPEDPTLRRSRRAWQVHDAAEFSVNAQLGRSNGRRAGLVDSTIEEYAYTPPLREELRVYAHLDQAEGDPVQGTTWRHAAGAGVEYHDRDWLATVELLEIDRASPATQVSVAATPDDHWRIGGSWSARTLDIPLAAVVVGVQADRAALDVGYRVSEAREFGVTLHREQFTDGNLRGSASGSWRERLVTGPVYHLEARLDLDTSANTRPLTNYFNPLRDESATLTLQNQWQQFRHYGCALAHEIAVTVGDYRQQHFGSGVVAALRYTLNYDVNDRVVVRAGIGRGVRPYDGARERLDVLTLYALGRF